MTGKRKQIRAVFLAAIMVISVFGMAMAFAGAAAADDPDHTPDHEEWINDQEKEVTVDVTDEFDEDETVLVTVTNPTDDDGVTYDINPDETSLDGVDIDRDDGEIEIDPTDDRISGWVDGTVVVEVEHGDEEFDDYEFYVDTQDPSAAIDTGDVLVTDGDDLIGEEEPDTLEIDVFANSVEDNPDASLTDAAVTITGPDGYEEELDEDDIDATSEEFDLEVGEDIDAFDASGEYLITVEAVDEAGNEDVAGEHTFWVDLEDHAVDNVEVDHTGEVISDADIASGVYDESEGHVIVEFDDDTIYGPNQIDADSVVVVLYDADGEDGEYSIEIDEFEAVEGSSTTFVSPLDTGEDEWEEGIVETDAYLEVENAEDLVDNDLDEESDIQSDEYDIITSTPEIVVEEIDDIESESGYVNLTGAIEIEEGEIVNDVDGGDDVKVDEIAVAMQFGDDEHADYRIDVTGDLANLYIEDLPDGDEALEDLYTDDVESDDYTFSIEAVNTTAQNYDFDRFDHTVNTGDDVTVASDYRHALQFNGLDITYDQFAEPVESDATAHTGDVDLDEVFVDLTAEEESLEYYVDGEPVGTTLEADDYHNEVVEVTAKVHDEQYGLEVEDATSVTVAFDFAPNAGVHIDHENADAYVGLNAVDELEDLAVELETVDDYDEMLDEYFGNEVSDLELEDFETEVWEYPVPGNVAGDVDENAHLYYTWEESNHNDQLPRDGEYEAEVTAANVTSDDEPRQQSPDYLTAQFEHNADVVPAYGDHEESDEFEVDYTNVTLEHATLTDSDIDEELTEGELWFDQPVGEVNEVEFEGYDAEIVNYEEEDLDTGLVEIELETADDIDHIEPQTEHAPDVNVTDVKPEFDERDNNVAEYTAEGTSTYTFELEPGMNAVSVPAVTGDVPNDAFDDEAVTAVWSYDAAEGEFEPDADLEAGQGYVVHADDYTYTSVNAANVIEEDDRAPASTSVEEGWNLVAAYQLGSQDVDQAMTPLGDRVYDVQKSYEYETTELQGGEGYWVFADQSGIHTVVPYEGMDSERPVIIDAAVEQSEAGTANITAAVDHENTIAEVTADSPQLGEITLDESDERAAGGVDFTATDVDVSEHEELELTVTVTDVNGNFDEHTFSADLIGDGEDDTGDADADEDAE